MRFTISWDRGGATAAHALNVCVCVSLNRLSRRIAAQLTSKDTAGAYMVKDPPYRPTRMEALQARVRPGTSAMSSTVLCVCVYALVPAL